MLLSEHLSIIHLGLQSKTICYRPEKGSGQQRTKSGQSARVSRGSEPLSLCLSVFFSLSFSSFSYLSFSFISLFHLLSPTLSLSLNLKYSNNILSRKELHLTIIILLLSYLPSHAMQHRPKINGRQLPPRLLEVKLPYDPVCPSVRWLDGRLVGRSVIIS